MKKLKKDRKNVHVSVGFWNLPGNRYEEKGTVGVLANRALGIKSHKAFFNSRKELWPAIKSLLADAGWTSVSTPNWQAEKKRRKAKKGK